MESRLSPLHYLSPEIHQLEQQQLFRRLWIFACMHSAVSENQAYVTRTIGGLPVILQNCEGKIRAFENSCPHRLMPLQTEEFGQGRMVCPYHGWVLDADGKTKTIPNEATLYRYPAEERQKLCLKEYAITVIGKLVFINLDPDPIDIDTQFTAEYRARLEEISQHFSNVAIHANIHARYNWKLNFENVLDFNHVPYIHPKSFLPLVKADIDKKDSERAQAPDEVISDVLSDQSFHRMTRMEIQTWPWHAQVDRYGPEGMYHNFYLFPNVNFISVGGVVFLVQQFDPLSAGETEVRFTLCSALENSRLPALPAILRGHLRSEIDVLNEDLVYLEALQAGLHAGSQRAQHGIYENRIQSFAAAYLRCMEGKLP